MTRLSTTFAALSDETRRAILARLSQGETQLSDLAAPFDMTQTAVTKHVRVLSEAGLVVVEKRGRSRHCRLHPDAMKEASDWLAAYERLWKKKLGQLQEYFSDEAS